MLLLGLFLLLLFFLVLEFPKVEVLRGGGDEGLAVERFDVAHQPLVHAVPEEEHFDPLLLQRLEVRRVRGGFVAAGRNVVDVLLLLGLPGDIVGERHVFGVRTGLCRCEAEELQNFFLVRAVLNRALLQHAAELAPELSVLRLILGELPDHREGALRKRAAEFPGHRAVLKDFARHVKRKVSGVNEPLHEAEVVREELLGVIHDENTLNVELQPVLLLAVIEIPRSGLRDIEEARVFEVAFNAVIRPGERIIVVVRQMLIELFVLLVLHVLRGQRPERLRVIHLNPLPGGFLLVVCRRLFFPEPDRGRNVVGVLRDDAAERPFVQEFLLRILERQDHIGAAGVFRRELGLIGAGSVRGPADGFVRGRFRGAGHYGHAVRDDKGAVETDTELTDQLGGLRLILREIAEEFFSARLRDRAEVLVRFVKRHADTVIGNRQGAGCFVRLHADMEKRIVLREERILNREEAKLINRVRGV